MSVLNQVIYIQNLFFSACWLLIWNVSSLSRELHCFDLTLWWTLCVTCLEAHRCARERWLWALQCAFLAGTSIPPGVLLQWWRSGSCFPGLWSRCCRGTVKAAVLGFANGSVSGVIDGHSLIAAFTWQVQCLVSGLRSTHCSFLRPIEVQTFLGIRCY